MRRRAQSRAWGGIALGVLLASARCGSEPTPPGISADAAGAAGVAGGAGVEAGAVNKAPNTWPKDAAADSPAAPPHCDGLPLLMRKRRASSLAELTTLVGSALPGDEIILADGSYDIP